MTSPGKWCCSSPESQVPPPQRLWGPSLGESGRACCEQSAGTSVPPLRDGSQICTLQHPTTCFLSKWPPGWVPRWRQSRDTPRVSSLSGNGGQGFGVLPLWYVTPGFWHRTPSYLSVSYLLVLGSSGQFPGSFPVELRLRPPRVDVKNGLTSCPRDPSQQSGNHGSTMGIGAVETWGG